MQVDQEPSPPEEPRALAISDPIPASVLAWDPSIERPTTLPEKYDDRIPVTSIYYIPSTKQYVVADRCTKCKYIQQACNRALPSCSWCAPSGDVCTPCSDKYVRLPLPKQKRGTLSLLDQKLSLAIELGKRKSSRPKRLCSDITKEKLLGTHATKSPRGRSKSKTTVNREKGCISAKVLETSKNVIQTSAEAMEVDSVTNPLTPPEPSPLARPRGRRRPEEADYYVPDALTPTWKYATPPKNSNKSNPAPKLELKTVPFSRKISQPAIWAETREDLLRALPTHPSIMAQHGLGYYGELPEVLILEGPGWDQDKWMGLGTLKLTRKWRYSWEPSKTPPKIQEPAENSLAPPMMEANDNASVDNHNPGTSSNDDQFDSVCEHFRRLPTCPKCSPNLPDVFSRDYVRLSPSEPELSYPSDNESLIDFDNSEPGLCYPSDDDSSSAASSCGPVTPHHPRVRTLDKCYRDPTTTNVLSDLSSMSIWDPGEYYEVVGSVPPQTPPSQSPNSVPHDPAINAAEERTSVSQDIQIHENTVVERRPDFLPPEAGLLKNTHDTRDPIRLIVSRGSQLFPFHLPEHCAYAFLGFFYITDLQTTSMPDDDTNSSGTVDIGLTLQWAGDQLFESMSAPRPWWRPLSASSAQYDFSPIPDDSDEIELMSYQLLEGIMSYPLPRSMEIFHIPPAWHCIECGRLNAVTPFRTRWSWACRSCGMIARDDNFPTIDPEAVCDPLPALPIPIDSTHAIHTRSVASTGEEMVTHVFRNSKAFVQHVLPPGDSLIQANQVFVDLQKEGNFMRVDLASGKMSHLSYDVPSCGQMLRSPTPVQETWRWVEQHVHRRPGLLEKCKRCARELKEMHCVAFISKGWLKGQSIEPGHVLFCALGASLTLKLSTFDRGGTPRMIDLVMAHGDRVFVDSVFMQMTYVVRHTGPSCLLAARWVSPVRERVDLGKILERTT